MAGPFSVDETLQAPGAVRWIARTLEEAGYETWAVGGAVRDALAGRPSGDWDLTTRATPKAMRRIFRRTVPLGIDHGTVGVLARDGTMYEVTTFRRDVETTGRHAVVAFAQTLDEDLARRDFTINAVAWHPLREVLHDPYEGALDLRRGVLRTVGDPGERFAEDYLRVLRALRFAGRFGLRVEGETWRALCRAVPHLGGLSAERVREELDKVLAGPRPSAALALEAASGVLGFFHPELDTPEARRRLPLALRTVDLLPPDPGPEARLAALLSAGGETGSAVAILLRLKSSNRRVAEVGALAGALAALEPGDGAGGEGGWGGGLATNPPRRRRWMASLGRPLLPRVLPLLAARARAGGGEDRGPEAGMSRIREEAARLLREIRHDLRSGVPLAPGELALGGRELIRAGYRPGPAFGEVFERLFEEVLDDPSRNDAALLLARAEALLAERAGGTSEADPAAGA